jgi:hypothetical protein
MTRRRLAAAAALPLLLVACSGDPAKLHGVRWVLDPSSIARLGVEVPAGTIVDLVFADGSLHGNSGCNDYEGSYDAGNGSLDLGDIQVSAKSCEDPAVVTLDAAYLEAFATMDGWRVGETSDGRPSLTLTGSSEVALRYTAVEDSA